MPPALLQVSHLSRTFGTMTAVDDINLTLESGQLLGLLGPNGAGKSTTIRMLAGLLEPSSGTIRYQEWSLADHPTEAKRLFGYVADQPLIFPLLTGWEYVQFVGGLYGFSSDEIKRKAWPLLERFHLIPAIHRRADHYSHGMQQKLALVAQLVHEPQVLLADEPTVGLDPASAAEMSHIFREFCQAGHAILISTHLLNMAQELCDTVVILSKGRLIAEGSPQALVDNAGDSLQELFLRLTREEDTGS